MLKKIAVAAALFLAGCTTQPKPVPPTVPPPAAPVEVQIIGINDFHGNLETPTSPPSVRMADGSILKERLGGAAALAATVKRLRQPNSITVSAGDLIGASPLVSAYFLDEPTIQAMNAIGLGLNAVGNHEFDKGSAELLRMQNGGCEKHTTPHSLPRRAVRRREPSSSLPPTSTARMGRRSCREAPSGSSAR